ncbi:Coiled-coil and C2 domain-containing protein 1B [Podila verticillata]|nr:Coiled-coil and C2 domain-containing protein 1B [Podila verticillata]
MFAWKKQNPPSKQRAAAQDTEDYSNLIAQGLKLANEDIDENDDYMDEDGDLDGMDLDDPDLLAELQGLTGEAPPKPKATPPAPSPAPVVPPPQAPQAKPKPPTPIPTPTPAPTPAPAPAPAPSTAKPTPPLANKASSQPNPALAGLGLDLDGVMDDDDDDEEVELTEDDWNDPHFMAQLQSLGGKTDAKSQLVSLTQTEPLAIETQPPVTPTSTSHSQQPISPTSSPTFTRKPSSTTSSMIAIPPRDNPYDDHDDGDSITTTQTDEKPSTTRTKATKHLEDIPKVNHADLLRLLKTRDTQYKKAALEAKKAGNTTLAVERMKIFKSLEKYIRLVEEGGFLDLELYPVPDAPSATPPPALAPQPLVEPLTTDTPLAKAGNEAKPTSRRPTIASSPVEPTTQVTNSIAEATGEDMRSGMKVRGAINGGIEFRQLAADDDFQIVSNSDADTYDMLESQLESQIKICTSTSGHYYQRGDKQTALQFHKFNKIFKTDLVSLQSYRKHAKKPPAFHFQDVRFEIEVGFYQEIGLNELSLNIIRAWDLSHKDVQASDIEAYVSWDFGWPTENMPGTGTGKGVTPTVKKTSQPDFGFKKTLNIERTRFQRFVERRKATFEVYHYRGIFRASYLLGKVQVPLQPLLDHSEIHEVFPIMDSNNRRSTGGKIELKITLQRPLLKPEIAVKEEKWLVIDEFNSGGLGFPSLLTASTPQPRNASATGSPLGRTTGAAAKSTRTPATPSPRPAPRVLASTPSQETPKVRSNASPAPQAPTPRPTSALVVKPEAVVAPSETQDEKDKALDELNSVELLVSNMVLEAEIQAAQDQIHNAKALEIKMKLLVIQVQTGQLTMEAYCKTVNARVDKDKQLAIQLNRLGLRTEAAKAMKRFKIMAAEMKEVEEAMAAQGDEDEEEE